ncbi:MAG: Na+/H+ antiporter NhaC family protein [Bacteroidaceae bacterium]|nr:Na+/H+ antiporter NhaC family protein [Bacteroidaceae bacterium]
MEERISPLKGLFALSPLIVFLLLYLALSVLVGDFYAMPITVAFLLSCLYALVVLRGRPITERFDVLTEGASSSSLMMMIWIFILAGAFASTAKGMGAIDATVNLTLALMPEKLILPGLFLASCFVSLSVGTSVGTIAALTPIAAGVAQQTGLSLPMIVAIVVGGAYFGDNLSFISDTTIMATRTQGCELRDKFRMNLRIAMPAAFITMILYAFIGYEQNAAASPGEISYVRVMPYLFVLIAAIAGMNVMLVLTLGTLMALGMGLLLGVFDVMGGMKAMGEGIMGMSELIIVTLMAGGLIGVIRRAGGIDFLLQQLTQRIRGRRGAECSIAALVTLTDLCTANNTIAILTVGPLAREISMHYGVDPRRSACLLDTFSCFAQGLIPYGAQMLIACGLASVNPLQIIPHLYYPYILGIIATIYIFIHHEQEQVH